MINDIETGLINQEIKKNEYDILYLSYGIVMTISFLLMSLLQNDILIFITSNILNLFVPISYIKLRYDSHLIIDFNLFFKFMIALELLLTIIIILFYTLMSESVIGIISTYSTTLIGIFFMCYHS